MELFKGQITLNFYKEVKTQETKEDTKKLAHEELSSTEFLNELTAIVEAKGYIVQAVATELNSIDEDDEKDKDGLIQGKMISTRFKI